MIFCLAGLSQQLQAQAIGQRDDFTFIATVDALHGDDALATAQNPVGGTNATFPNLALQEDPYMAGIPLRGHSWNPSTGQLSSLNAEFGYFDEPGGPTFAVHALFVAMSMTNRVATSTPADALAAASSMVSAPPPGTWSVDSAHPEATVIGTPGLNADHEYRVHNNGQDKVKVVVKDAEGKQLSSNDVLNGNSLDVAVPKGATLTIKHISGSASGTYSQVA